METSCDTSAADKTEGSSEEVKAGQVPDWLNKDFVEKALNNGADESRVRVESCEVREATKLGDNYSSIVYRAIAQLENGQVKKLIIKCLPSNEVRRKFANNLGVFAKEINVYERHLPIYSRMHSERIDAEAAIPWPKCIHTLHDSLRDFIILEDLDPYGFRMADRRTGLTEQELRLALQSLGRFHAYSVAYRLEDPETFHSEAKDKFHDTCFTESALEGMKPFFQGCLASIAELLRSWDNPKYDSVADQIVDMAENFLITLTSIVNRIDEDTAVLCHGDFWVNNFLFRYEDEPCEFKFVDFQILRYGSPALDLWYLMATSTNTEVRRGHWKLFLKEVYLTSLRDTLDKLGHHDEARANGIFSSDWLAKEMASKELFAFATTVTTTTAALASVEDVPDMDAMTDDSFKEINPFKKLTRGKLFKERFRGLIDDFIESGLFH